jgi:hypothetical protein
VGVHLVQLKTVFGVGAWTARDHQHRHAIEKGFADPACGMREPRGRYDSEHADRVGQAADGVRHERGAALMRHQHLSDAV